MSRHITEIIAVVLIIAIYFIGCVDNNNENDDDDASNNGNEEGRDILIEEIDTYIQISFDQSIQGNVSVMFPTLVDENNQPIEITNLSSDDNWSMRLQMSKYGWCINATLIPRPATPSQPAPFFYQRMYFQYNFSGAKFNTGKKCDISDRYFEDTPGISIWEEDNNEINSDFALIISNLRSSCFAIFFA